MPRLEFQQAARGQTQIDKRGDQGELLGRVTTAFRRDDDFATSAETLGVDKELLIDAVDQFERTGRDSWGLVIVETSVKREFKIMMRGLKEKATSATEIIGENAEDATRKVLAIRDWSPAHEPYVYWESGDELCAVDLDVDKEYGQRWTSRRMKSLFDHLSPRPFCGWITHGGGLRLMYKAMERFTAEEIAAVAYLNLSQSQTYVSLELKLGTRHPGYARGDAKCSEPEFAEQNFDRNSLRRWLREYDAEDAEVKSWLKAQSLELGQRYDHDRCPVQPSAGARGAPVVVGDSGVYCYVCAAHGITSGSSKPGFFPYSSLVGNSAVTTLFYVFDNFAHFEHARYILESKFQISGSHARLVYSACLKMHHERADDPRISRAFVVGQDLIRMDRRWTNLNGDLYTRDLRPIIERLPACSMPTRAGGFVPDPAKVALFQQNFDLTRYGYPALTPIFGLRIYSQFLESDARNLISIVIQNQDLSHENMAKFRPRYVGKNARMPLEKAWDVVEEACPGVNRNLVYALIAAKGVAESGASMPPMIFITGPTGSAKSSTISLAASMCGDYNSEVVWTANLERVRQAISDSKDIGSYVTFNEILKESSSSGRSPTQAMDFLLNLTPSSVSHKMWVGPVRLGSLPVFAWTDTAIPIELSQDAQLARRLIHCHLPTTVDWKSSLKRTVGAIKNMRTVDEYHADACNAIVSEVIDRFFNDKFTFEEICERLGFASLAGSSEAEDSDDALRSFFTLVTNAPKLEGSDAVRWKGRGFKVINRGVDSPLLSAWMHLCDEAIGGKFTSSRRCKEKDWQKLVGADEPVEFEIRNHGPHSVAVRFINVNRTRITYKTNEELLNGKHVELESGSK